MSDWVEYCNLSVGYWGRLRAANGYKRPHNVKYWSVGNENWGGHEIGAKTVAQWGPFVRESAKLMRGADKSIKLFAAATPDEGWTLPLLKSAGYLLDYISIHRYYVGESCSNPNAYLECMMRTMNPERDITRTIAILEKAGYGGGRVAIAFDEWNLRYWFHPGLGAFRRDAKVDYPGRRRNDIAATYNMADAVFASCFLNTCLRHGDIVKMANFSPIVNTRGAIYVHPKGIVKRTTFHVFWMYTNLLEPNVQLVSLVSPDLKSGKRSVPVLDGVMTVSDDGSRRVLAIANKHPTDKIRLDVSAFTSAEKLEGTSLAGESAADYNDIGHENRVVPRKTVFSVENGCIELPPHSVSCINIGTLP